MTTYAAGQTVVKPFVSKMKSVIHHAAQAKSLVANELIEFNHDDDTAYGMAAPPSKCAKIGRCAMGELLFKAGYSNNELQKFDIGGDWDQDVYQTLWDEYRIDKKDVSKIIGGNDSVASCSTEAFTKRAKKLDTVLDKLGERKRVNPYLTRLNDIGDAIGPLPTAEEIKVMKKFNVYVDYEYQYDDSY